MISQTRVLYLATLMLVIPWATTIGEAKTCKCPVSGEDVEVNNAEATSVHRDATLYLCCDECKGKFEADRKKYATKANMQIVSTGQARQVKCPISGHALDADQSIVVNAIEISFCCQDCKSEAAAAEGEKQLAMLFGDEAFAKAFVVVVDKE